MGHCKVQPVQKYLPPGSRSHGCLHLVEYSTRSHETDIDCWERLDRSRNDMSQCNTHSRPIHWRNQNRKLGLLQDLKGGSSWQQELMYRAPRRLHDLECTGFASLGSVEHRTQRCYQTRRKGGETVPHYSQVDFQDEHRKHRSSKCGFGLEGLCTDMPPLGTRHLARMRRPWHDVMEIWHCLGENLPQKMDELYLLAK